MHDDENDVMTPSDEPEMGDAVEAGAEDEESDMM